MDGSDQCISSSSSANRSPSSSLPKGTGKNSQQKHFMSPTVSVASKANLLRKKVLAEKNESIDTTPLERPPNIDSTSSSSAELGENKENPLSDVLTASSPYDPLTNYLSPRPKFLRYKPNRRQEIILRRENEIKEGNCSLCVSGEGLDTSCPCGSLINHYPDEDLNQEDGENTGCDDEIEEWVAEGEKGWVFSGVLKWLLLLVVLVLSTSYISSMNSPNPAPVAQAVEGLKNRYHMIHDHVYGFVKSLEARNHSLAETEGRGMCFACTHRSGVEMIEDVKLEGVENSNELIEGEGKRSEDGEYSECAESEAMDIVEYEDYGETSKLGDVVEVQDEESKLVSHPEIVDRGEVSDIVEVNSDVEGTMAVELSESPIMIDGANHQGILSGLANVTCSRENEAASESQEGEVIGNEMGVIDTTNHSEEPEALIDEAEGRFDMMHVLYQGILISCMAGLVTSTLTYSILSLFDYIDSKKKRNSRKHSTSKNAESCSEPMAEQKCDSAHANKEDKHIEHPVSIENSRSLVDSMEEDTKETFQSRPLSVELLGEFVVEEMSSSLGSRGVKSRMVDSEVSSYSVFMEKGTTEKAHSVPGPVQPALLEISTMNSPSNGRFTDEKTVVKKQKGRAEDRIAVTTPVRRSSRIRNRAASP